MNVFTCVYEGTLWVCFYVCIRLLFECDCVCVLYVCLYVCMRLLCVYVCVWVEGTVRVCLGVCMRRVLCGCVCMFVWGYCVSVFTCVYEGTVSVWTIRGVLCVYVCMCVWGYYLWVCLLVCVSIACVFHMCVFLRY